MAHYLGHIYNKNIAVHLKFKCTWLSFIYLANLSLNQLVFPLFQKEFSLW